MSRPHSTILARINDLYEERAALWALRWRDETVRRRLAEIRDALDALWSKRRLEKRGIDPDAWPDARVAGGDRVRRFAPRAHYRRGRLERREQR